MAQDERYRTNAGRVVNRATLIPRMFEMTAKITRADLLAKLEAAGVPGGPINTLEDVFADPQVLARKHAHRPAEQVRQGRLDPGRALADHHQRRAHGAPTARRRCSASIRRRCCGRSGRRESALARASAA